MILHRIKIYSKVHILSCDTGILFSSILYSNILLFFYLTIKKFVVSAENFPLHVCHYQHLWSLLYLLRCGLCHITHVTISAPLSILPPPPPSIQMTIITACTSMAFFFLLIYVHRMGKADFLNLFEVASFI